MTSIDEENNRLLQDFLIVQLAKAGVSQPQIGKLVRVSTKRVNDVAKWITRAKRKEQRG